jgi:hypothetical protein
MTKEIYFLKPTFKERKNALQFEILKINYKRYRMILRAEKITK